VKRPSISKRVRFRVFTRFGYRCVYCGHGVEDGAKLVLDHVIAVANGGSNDEENLVAACQPCNAGKSDMGCYACGSHECVGANDGAQCPSVEEFLGSWKGERS
jgi:5-methylcytosine-specific restriction endonuclease McrA